MMNKNKEMKQGVVNAIKEWMNEYAYVDNVYRLYHYYDKQLDNSKEPNIIGLTCTSVYENLIVSLAKFFNIKKSKEDSEMYVECEVLKKCNNNADVFKINEAGRTQLNYYDSLWNSKDYKEFLTNIKTRRDTKYAHKDKDKHETVRNYYVWLILSNLKRMLNDLSSLFDAGSIIDEKSIISGLENENEFLNIK